MAEGAEQGALDLDSVNVDKRDLEDAERGSGTRNGIVIESEAAARLRADLKKAEDMPFGTIVSFQLATRNRRFTYAALYIDGVWWLTGNGVTESGTGLKNKMSHAEFTQTLASRGRTDAWFTDVKVATEFDLINL